MNDTTLDFNNYQLINGGLPNSSKLKTGVHFYTINDQKKEENIISKTVQTSTDEDETEIYTNTNENESDYEELVSSTIATENFSTNDYSTTTDNEEYNDFYIITDTSANEDGSEVYINTNENEPGFEELVSSTILTENLSTNDHSVDTINEEYNDLYIVTDTSANEDDSELYTNIDHTKAEVISGTIVPSTFTVDDHLAGIENEENDNSHITVETNTDEAELEVHTYTNQNKFEDEEEFISNTIVTETSSINDYSTDSESEENDGLNMAVETSTNEDETEIYTNNNEDEFEEKEELASNTVLTETTKTNDIPETVINLMEYWDEPICHDDVCCCNSLCKRPVQKRRPESNGCGPKKFFLSGFIKLVGNFFEFTRACNTHDNCYGTCGKPRTSCDEAFLSDMISSCDENSGNWFSRQICQLTAKTFNAAVRRFGRDPFLHAQMDNCLCLTIGVRRDIN
ncbi:unnamed protein product [Adineta steineri]|uniref:Uncharacterized protein n=1 Tax=Adineta steineri TaxID=433720 RepID=A0A815RVI2_9BILA|nr:unnamed protein product [Adineta steineri]CAF3598886.1 unnamed protein product [Adineta steineri]